MGKRSIFIIMLLFTLLLHGCLTGFAGRKHYQNGQTAFNDKKYDAAAEALSLSLKDNPGFDKASDLLRETFETADNYYKEVINKNIKAETDSNPERVELPSDRIFDSYSKLKKINEITESVFPGSFETLNYKESLKSWKDKAVEEHLRIAGELLKNGNPVSAKNSYKHLEMITEKYDVTDRDIVPEMKEKALTVAQSVISVIIIPRKELQYINDPEKVSKDLLNRIQSSEFLSGYLTPVHSRDLIYTVLNDKEAGKDDKIIIEKISEAAVDKGIDLILAVHLDNGSSVWSIEETAAEEYLKASFTTIKPSGRTQIHETVTTLRENKHTLHARVSALSSIIDCNQGTQIFKSGTKEIKSLSVLEYTEIIPETVNDIFIPRDEYYGESLAEIAKRDMLLRKENNFHYLAIDTPKKLYLENSRVRTLNQSVILSEYLQTTLGDYREYRDNMKEIFYESNSAENTLTVLWNKVISECYKDAENFLE